jgi:hypothetical protein
MHLSLKSAQTSRLRLAPKSPRANWKSALLFSVLLVAAPTLPATPKLPLTHLVDDRTLVALTVSDAPALLRGWDASPLAASWNDPQIVKFLAPLREQLAVERWDADTQAATGLNVRELLALVEGEALVALPAFDVRSAGVKTLPPFLLALEVGASGAKLEKILAATAEKLGLREETETFAGVRVQLSTLGAPTEEASAAPASAPRSFAWALVEGVWLLSPAKERVFAAIDALQRGGLPGSLGASERFQRTRQRIGAAQGLVYLNVPAIYPLIQDAASAAKAKAGTPSNPLGLDPEVALKALGLDVFGEAYLAVTLEPTRARVDSGLAYTEERGLIRLLSYQPGPPTQPGWVPAKWSSVGSVRFSLPKAYAGLEALVNSVSPLLYGMAQGQLRALDKKLEVDLTRDLIGSLGEEVVTASALPPGQEPGTVPAWSEMDQFLAISLVNEAAFVRALNALKQLAGPAAEQLFAERDYLGHTLYTVNLPSEPGDSGAVQGVNYAIAENTLLIGVGSPAPVENALQGMASRAGDFWQRADVKTALTDLPADAVAVEVQDLRVLLASLVESLVGLQASFNAEKPADAQQVYADLGARPEAEVWARHWGLAAGWVSRTSEGVFSTHRMVYPQR